jgi:hypothetical protein
VKSLALALACAALCASICTSSPACAKPQSSRTAAPDRAYIEQLVARAHTLHLADRTTWLRLVHYRRGVFGGWSSQADGPLFFLAENGKDDPSAELDATLRGFFGPEPAKKGKDYEHPYCRFPARLAWLNAQLEFDFARVPRRTCPRFLEFSHQLRARSITLVFSSYYLNSPASAFGHTFFRINKDDRRSEETDLELLDYGIDFSATVDTNNALAYAFKGLTGMFPGVFRRVPFYLKVREYNDHDSRDLWEYELNLTPPEVSMVVAHLWELGATYFDYYYLSENCSYHMLDALEVANPSMHLLDRLGWPVLPADTVKAVVAQPGLVKSIHYRPSLHTQVESRLGSLTSKEQSVVLRLMSNPDARLPPGSDAKEQVKLFDAALDLADLHNAGDLTKPVEQHDPAAERLQLRLLERRAAIPRPSEPLVVPPPSDKMPHVGHGSRRIGFGPGYSSDRGYYDTVSFRLALHDLADPTHGYPETAAIEFMPTTLRYYVEKQRPSVEDFSLIRVTSLTPMNRFDHSWSWTVRAGATRLRDGGCRCFAGLGEFGAGWSAALFTKALVFYALADAELLLPVEGGLWHTLRAGIGPSGGLRLKLDDDLLALATSTWTWLPGQKPTSTWRAEGTVRWQYVHDFAFDLGGSAQPGGWSAQIASLLYF